MFSSSPRRHFALNLGSSRFSIISLEEKEEDPAQISQVSLSSTGIHRGAISDYDAAKACLAKLLDEAEEQFGCCAREVAVGISTQRLSYQRHSASLELDEAPIKERDIKELRQRARDSLPTSNQVLLHIEPLHYGVDERAPTESPRGQSGSRLHGDYLAIVAEQTYAGDVTRLCNSVGLQVSHLFARPLAASHVVDIQDYAQRGAVLLNIGAGVCEGVVYLHGHAQALVSIPIGGQLMTRDLALGLHLQDEQAEQVKLFFGLDESKEASLPVADFHGNYREVHASDAYNILAPRIHELCNLLAEQLQPFKGCLGGGIILVGGTSLTRGLPAFMQSTLKIHVRTNPSITGFQGELCSHDAVSIGLAELCRQTTNASRPPGGLSSLWHETMSWLKELA